MLPNPLHPAVVHFPIVLVVLLPFFAIGALWAIRKGVAPRKAWSLPLVLAGALTLSAFVALRTGQAQEDRVGKVVPRGVIEGHEEAAERFLVLSGVLLLIAGAGLAPGVVGRSARLVSAAGAIALVVAGVQVGASGGELVYKHGAARVYAATPDAASPAASVSQVPAGAGADEDRD